MKPQTHQPREQSRGGGGRNKKSGHNEQQQQPVKLIVKRSYSTDTSINTAASTTTSNVASVVVPPPMMGGSTGGGLVLAKRPSPSSQQRPSVVRYYLFIKRVVYLSLTRLSRFFFSSFPSFLPSFKKTQDTCGFAESKQASSRCGIISSSNGSRTANTTARVSLAQLCRFRFASSHWCRMCIHGNVSQGRYARICSHGFYQFAL